MENLYIAKFGRPLFHEEVKGILSNNFQALGEHYFVYDNRWEELLVLCIFCAFWNKSQISHI